VNSSEVLNCEVVAMPRGGARPGAGRPKGSKTIQTKSKVAIENAAAALEASGEISAETAKMKPLEVIVRAMLLAVERGQWSQAANLAEKAAPYVHPKLSSVDLNATVKRDPALMSDDELVGLLSAANAKTPEADTPSVH
jgi:hypothetical protein